MHSPDRNAKRERLLERVDSLRDPITLHIGTSEANRTLAVPLVQLLSEAGMFRLAVPAQLGGDEADPMLHMEVIEALSYIYPSCGWAVTLGTSSTAILGAFLPDAAIDDLFANNQVPLTAGVFHPTGTAKPTDGGYLVSGRWRFASGIWHAEWISAGVIVENEKSVSDSSQSPPTIVSVVLPVSQIEIHDSWHSMGLRGTGSSDFVIEDVFVPYSHTFTNDWAAPTPQRGGPRFSIGLPAALVIDELSVALGIARRALDEMTKIVACTQSKYRKLTLSERPAVHKLIAQYELKLCGARALAFSIYEEIWQQVCSTKKVDLVLQAQCRANAVYIAELAADIVMQAFRYGGISALFPPNVHEMLLRDINAVSQHVLLSDTAYEEYGSRLLQRYAAV